MYKFILMIIIVLFISSSAFAEQYQLPSGNWIDIDNISGEELLKIIELDKKTNNIKEKATETVTEVVKQMDPTKLDEWRKLITGTIKDVCSDLNVTVNEFVKTPVGLGISALIIYKVAGKELLSDALDIVVMIPLWIFTTGIVLFLSWYCFSYKLVYQNITYNENNKKIKSNPIRMTRYDWKSHIDEDKARLCVIVWFMVVEFIMTIITLLLVLG